MRSPPRSHSRLRTSHQACRRLSSQPYTLLPPVQPQRALGPCSCWGRWAWRARHGTQGHGREQLGWTLPRVSLPMWLSFGNHGHERGQAGRFVHLLYLYRRFSSLEASDTPRRLWCPGKWADHARRPHFCREPSPWHSHPAFSTTYDTSGSHTSVSGWTSPHNFRLVYMAPSHASTECLLGTSHWTRPKPTPYLPPNLHLSSSPSFQLLGSETGYHP